MDMRNSSYEEEPGSDEETHNDMPKINSDRGMDWSSDEDISDDKLDLPILEARTISPSQSK